MYTCFDRSIWKYLMSLSTDRVNTYGSEAVDCALLGLPPIRAESPPPGPPIPIPPKQTHDNI